MKKSKKFFVFIIICSFIFACKDKIKPIEVVEIIVPPIVIEPELKIDTVAYATKEPFVKIKDSGLEAYLILKEIDTDNQVNGKVALIDLDKINTINFDFIHKSQEEKIKVDFLSQKYNLELSKEFNENTGLNNRLVIKSISDLKYFRNLTSLEGSDLLSIETFIIDFENNLSTIIVPRNTKFLNVNSCKKLVQLIFRDMNTSTFADLTNIESLFTLELSGNLSNVKFNENAFIKILDISNTSIKNLNLSKCPNLEYLNISNATQLSQLTLPYKISRLNINNTALEDLESNSIDITYVKFENNKILSKINLKNASFIYSSISRNNSKLTEIHLNQNAKVDTTAYHPHASGPDSKLWQKDSWTKWVVKK